MGPEATILKGGALPTFGHSVTLRLTPGPQLPTPTIYRASILAT